MVESNNSPKVRGVKSLMAASRWFGVGWPSGLVAMRSEGELVQLLSDCGLASVSADVIWLTNKQ